MKVYVCQQNCHHKNYESVVNMMNHNKAEYIISNNLDKLDDSFDLVLCIDKFYPPDAFPKKCKVVYGPQFFVFPENPSHPVHAYEYDQSRFFFNTLTQWNVDTYKEFIPFKMPYITTPFGINIDGIPIRTKPKNNKVMIYFKHRHTRDLDFVKSYLDSKHIEYSVISYGSYNDATYKAEMDNCKFIIWIGSHESQGFAFQEALARNIPILLWDVTSMYDEMSSNNPVYGYLKHTGKKLLATTANVWSEECGVRFTNESEFESKFIEMNQKYDADQFNPRKVISSQVSLEAAYKNLLKSVGIQNETIIL